MQPWDEEMRERREQDEEEEQSRAEHRFAVAQDGPQQPTSRAADRGRDRRGSAGDDSTHRRPRFAPGADEREALCLMVTSLRSLTVNYPFVRARGSSRNTAKSQSRTQISTASVTSRNRACSNG